MGVGELWTSLVFFNQNSDLMEKKGLFSPLFLNKNSDLMKKKLSPRSCF